MNNRIETSGGKPLTLLEEGEYGYDIDGVCVVWPPKADKQIRLEGFHAVGFEDGTMSVQEEIVTPQWRGFLTKGEFVSGS
jgi:hypothetical protein